MSWFSLDVATTLIGILVGIVFFFDGWKRNPLEVVAFYKTSRITGLVWVFGGGAISGFLAYFAQDKGRVVVVYVSSFALAVIGLLLLAAIVMFVYFILTHSKKTGPNRGMADALPFVLFFLANGLDATLERIDSAQQRADELTIMNLETSRRYTLQFITGLNEFVNKDLKSGRKGENFFKYFLDVQLRTFLVMFFEKKEVLEKYRAAFFQREGESLLFVAGADVQGTENEFSGQALGLQTSLGGKAILENRMLFYPEDAEDRFKPSGSHSRYKSFVVIPVPYKPGSPDSERIGFLSVDTVENDAPFKAEFQVRLLTYFSNVIANVHAIYLGTPPLEGQ